MILRITFLLVLLMPLLASAQSSDSVAYLQVDTKDGNRYIGKVRELNVERIILEIGSEEVVTIDPLNIKRATVVSPVKFRKGKYWLENGHVSRYLWGPSGYGLSRGTGYYQNVDVLANQIAYGFTDHFSLSAGVMPFRFLPVPITNFWVMPKVSVPIVRNKIGLSGGVFYGSSVDKVGASPTENRVVLGYGIMTFGNRDYNVSIGSAYGNARGIRMEKPAVSFSYLLRMGQMFYLVSENYVLPDPFGEGTAAIMASGGRWTMRRATLELGIATFLSTEAYQWVPWVSFVLPFGRKPG